MKKLFGGLNITWKKVIIGAILAGIYTAVMAILPITKDTSFRDITATFEVWVLFGILIITNSKSPKESALKCFVFFLISQPLIYLIQVPFSWLHWDLLQYYKYWFIWTILCLPMGYIGYKMKDNKWYGLLILSPMIVFVGYHYFGFISEAIYFFPNHLLSAIFCIVTMFMYALFIFDNKILKIIETVIVVIVLIIITILGIRSKVTYTTTMLFNEIEIKDNSKVEFDDPTFADYQIKYEENLQENSLLVSFKKTGDVKITITNDDKKCEIPLTVSRYSYEKKEGKCE